MRLCEFPECGRPVSGHGLCNAHRKQRAKGGPLRPVGDRDYMRQLRIEQWARLSPEERARRMAPALANLDKRNKHPSGLPQRRAWAEGRGGPKRQLACLTCDIPFMPASGSQRYCSRECKATNSRGIKYGTTGRGLLAIQREQADACAICGKHAVQLVVDHDHHTGLIRGLLCVTCNTGLGKLGDSPDMLRRALAYLTR